MKNSIYNYTIDELEQLVSPKFRAKQLYNWLYTKYSTTFQEMENLPKKIREELGNSLLIEPASIVKKESSSDGSKKYLLKAHDGHTYESVLLDMSRDKIREDGSTYSDKKYTICISSQVGCKIGCSFCLSAKGGFIRDLSSAEIVHQIVAIKKDEMIPQEKRVNIVFMGMGEPLDNFDNVIKAIKIISSEDGLAISPKRQTISTSGISPKIDRLGELNLGVMLAISLHAVDDTLRDELIPLNRAYNIESIIQALKRFPIDSRKRLMFEYLLIGDKNDSLDCAKKLVKVVSGIKAKVNLIYFNPYPNSPYKRPTQRRVLEFQEYLNRRGICCTIRESKGLDISAACGQLKERREL